MYKKILEYYFIVLFSIIPVAVVIGPTISLANILLIDISFIFTLIHSKNFLFLKKKSVILILIICVYLIFNSLISQDFSIGYKRNFGFIRFLILFIAFNYFFLRDDFYKKVFLAWLFTITLVCIDIYVEHFFGKNILGFSGNKAHYGDRIVSFFKDEPIVGSYINAFYLLLVGFVFHLLGDLSYKKKLVILFLSIILFFSILLTGERSALIKALSALMIFYSLSDTFKIKEKVILLIVIFTISISIYSNSVFLKSRWVTDNSLSIFKSKGIKKSTNLIKGNENLYLTIYRSGLTVWKNYPLFGVGNKNYRIVTCKTKDLIKTPEPASILEWSPETAGLQKTLTNCAQKQILSYRLGYLDTRVRQTHLLKTEQQLFNKAALRNNCQTPTIRLVPSAGLLQLVQKRLSRREDKQ